MKRRASQSATAVRERLLDVAVALFSEHGFDRASTRMIASGAGTAMSSITYHFGGKHGLHRAAMESAAALIGPSLSIESSARTGESQRQNAALECEALVDRLAASALDPSTGPAVMVAMGGAPGTGMSWGGPDDILAPICERLLELGRRARPDLEEEDRRALVLLLLGQVLILRPALSHAARALDLRLADEDHRHILRTRLRRNVRALMIPD